MGMGFAPTWLRQVSPPAPASQNHFNHNRRVKERYDCASTGKACRVQLQAVKI